LGRSWIIGKFLIAFALANKYVLFIALAFMISSFTIARSRSPLASAKTAFAASLLALVSAHAAPRWVAYDFEWNSQPGKVYDLLTSTDLATPVSAWPIYHDGTTLHQAIPSAGVITTLTAVPSASPSRFFAVRESDPAP
jgi:hypothetical protein